MRKGFVFRVLVSLSLSLSLSLSNKIRLTAKFSREKMRGKVAGVSLVSEVMMQGAGRACFALSLIMPEKYMRNFVEILNFCGINKN